MTAAEPDLEESATEVALTVIVGGLGTMAGAVYFPVESIVPQLAPEQPAPERLQLTTGIVPNGSSVAMNCCTPLF